MELEQLQLSDGKIILIRQKKYMKHWSTLLIQNPYSDQQPKFKTETGTERNSC